MFSRIKTWWCGKLGPTLNDPSAPYVIIGPGHYDRPWPAKVWLHVAKFWSIHWKWIIGTAIALIALILERTRK